MSRCGREPNGFKVTYLFSKHVFVCIPSTTCMRTAPAKVTSLFVRQEICHSRGNFAPALQLSPKCILLPGDYCDKDCHDMPPKDATWRRPRCVSGATVRARLPTCIRNHKTPLIPYSRSRSPPATQRSPRSRSRLGLHRTTRHLQQTQCAFLSLTYLSLTEATTRREGVSGDEGDKLVSWVAAGPRLPLSRPHPNPTPTTTSTYLCVF